MVKEKHSWLQPEYFKRFKCKCGSCRHCCCSGWKIGIFKKEYLSLMKLTCSKKLHQRMKSAFVDVDFPTEELYKRISPNWRNVCPMLDDRGLCMLQTERGEANLPTICKVYPRRYINNNGNFKATCTSSCEAVVELLMQEEKIRFVQDEIEAVAQIKVNMASDSQAVSTKGIEILQNRTISLNERIAQFCSFIGNKEYHNSLDMLEQALKELLLVMNKLSFLSVELEESRLFLEQRIKKSNHFVQEYLHDLELYQKNYPEESIWLENILVNHFFYYDIPCVDPRLRNEDCIPGVCLVYALTKLILIIRTKDNPSKEHFVDILSGLFHFVEHTAFYYNAFVLVKQPENLLSL